MTRKEILEEATKIVTKDRESQYGPPEDSFATIAEFWKTYWKAKGVVVPVNSVDVAAMMALLKLARIAVQPEKLDSWTDCIGYGACGGSIATSTVSEPPVTKPVSFTGVYPTGNKYHFVDPADLCRCEECTSQNLP